MLQTENLTNAIPLGTSSRDSRRNVRQGPEWRRTFQIQFAMKEHASKSSTPTSERKRVSASYAGFHPASPTASRIAAKASRKRGTKCEVKLHQAVRKLGLKCTMNDSSLPGCPDLVFKREKVAIFADGDFWHGRKLAIRIATLATGHNSSYWIQKIQSNVIRDRAVTRQLRALGWRVIRIWESQINSDIDRATARIANAVNAIGLASPQRNVRDEHATWRGRS